jgi:hypothetical protein
MTTPRAELEIKVNAGVNQFGAVTAPSAATISFVFPTTVGWEKYRLEVYGPPGWTPPGGWTVEGDVAVYTGVTAPPPDVVLPANTVRWGKWMPRLIVNDGRRNDAAEREMVDTRSGISMLSPTGLVDLGTQEEAQFGGAVRKWSGSIQAALRTIDTGLSGGGVPAPINVAGAVIVEDPANTRITRRLRAADIDPDFNIASFARTGPAGAALVRRGDTIGAGFAAAATYLSGPPTSASIANSYSGSTDGGDINLGAWTINTPFATGTATGTVKRSGSDAGADPALTVTLTATAGFVRNAAWGITWTSDVYYGVSALASLVGNDVYNAGLQAGFLDSLQQARAQLRAFTPATQYLYFLWPDEAQYTGGTEVFKDNGTGFVFPFSDIGSATILRNAVTRTYRVWRSDNLVASPFTIAVT